MKKIFLLCVAVSLISCGGDDSISGEKVSTPDSDIPDASDISDASIDDVVASDVSGQDISNDINPDVPDVSDDIIESDVLDIEADVTKCTPGELSCQGKTPTFCNVDGQLQTKPECMFLCANGVCTGECTPGEERCTVRDVEYCDANGIWQLDRVCPENCVQNECFKVWCCKDWGTRCECSANQSCNASTGTMENCPTSSCCWIQNGTGNCVCSDIEFTSCDDAVDHPWVSKIVNSCPE